MPRTEDEKKRDDYNLFCNQHVQIHCSPSNGKCDLFINKEEWSTHCFASLSNSTYSHVNLLLHLLASKFGWHIVVAVQGNAALPSHFIFSSLTSNMHSCETIRLMDY